MDSKKYLYPVLIATLLVTATVRKLRDASHEPEPEKPKATEQVKSTVPDTVSEFITQAAEKSKVQEPNKDSTYLPEPYYKSINNRKWTADYLGIKLTKRYDGGWDTLGTVKDGLPVFTWLEAMRACPEGFRLPRKEEFSKRSGKDNELFKGPWWTSTVTNMYTSKNVDYPSYHIFAATALANSYETKILFSEDNIESMHPVLCISDPSEYIVEAVSEVPDKITTKSGIITDISIEPHHEGPEGSDCYCGEGDGGILKIHLDSEKDFSEAEAIYEYGRALCGGITYDEEGNELAASEKCPKLQATDFNMLALFQKGAKFESKRCAHSVYTVSEVGERYISEFSCGDTVRVSFTGEIKEVTHIKPGEDDTDPELKGKEQCSYKIFNPDNGSTISTTHDCKNIKIGGIYRITGTVTYTDSDYENQTAVLSRMYPCCEGRGDASGDYYSSLDFEPIAVSN